jgi:glycosyltransferase involved in cell wall biosynthesis
MSEHVTTNGSPSDAQRRSILMFAYYYPPCHCWPTASMRAQGLALGLTNHGWDPTVVTRSNGCSCFDGDDVPEEPATASVIAVRRVEVRPSLLFRVSAATERWYGPELWRRVVHRLSKPVRDARWLTEKRNDWPRRALGVGRTLVRERDVRAVWTTSGPYRSIGVGRSLQQLYAIPWIADLRDSIARERVWKGTVDRMAGRHLRRRWFGALRRASFVVGVTPEEAEIDASALGRAVHAIPSGFDLGTWRSLRAADAMNHRNHRFLILYAGGYYRDRIELGRHFLLGLRRFVDAMPERPPIAFRYIGPHAAAFSKQATEVGCEDFFEDGGPVPPSQARREMIAADLLLLLTPTTAEGGMPGGKLYEYLASGAPILAVHGADRFVMGALRDAGGGSGASTAEEIAEVLKRRYDDWRLGRAERRPLDGLEDFTWKARAERLAGLLPPMPPPGVSESTAVDPVEEVVA